MAEEIFRLGKNGKNKPFENIVLSYNLQIVEFNEDLKIEKYLLSSEKICEEVSENEYNHENFGLYQEDYILVRNHFYMQIKKLEEGRENKEELIKIACEDIKKYADIFKFLDGDSRQKKTEIERMMELVLTYGGADQLYHIIKVYHEEQSKVNESEYGDDCVIALNFSNLYIRYGDYMLYIQKNIKKALKYYELTALCWGKEKNQRKASDMDVHAQYERIIRLVNNPRTEIMLWQEKKYFEGEENYKKVFVQYINDLQTENEQSICLQAAQFFHAIDRIKREKCDREKLRIPFLLAYEIRESSLAYILDMIRKKGDIDNLDDSLRKDILSRIKENNSSSLKLIKTYIEYAGENKNCIENCFDLLTLIDQTEQIKGLLRRDVTERTELAYYTSLETFSYMLPFKAQEDMLGRLSIMNISYMNDPNEGKILQKCLFAGKVPFEGDPKQRKNARCPYVYIKCFTPQIDFLPMWEMYGDHAKGCCLVLDWGKILEEGAQIPLYNVCYLSKNGSQYYVEAQYNVNLRECENIEKRLRTLERICKIVYERDNESLIVIHKVLNEILYLFKDASYSYEKEVRICYQFPDVDPVFRHTPGAFGKLFVETDFRVQLKEIILGPKFMNMADVIPYLQEQIDIMCRETKTNLPKITISDIAYG